MRDKGMFKTECEYCGKSMYAYAKNKRGDLPTVYCSKKCAANDKYDKKFDVRFK